MAGLFGAQPGFDIASTVAAERSRLPAMIAPPFMPGQRPPVFEIGQGTVSPGSFPTQRFGPGPTAPATGTTGARVASSTPVAMTAPTMAAPPQNPMSGVMNAVSAANTAAKLPGYAETLAPLWEAPTPGIGLNTIFSGQGPGSVAGGIDSAVNAGLGGGGLFGAAVPAAAVPGGATAATIGGIGNSAATMAFNPAVGAAGTAALAAAPLMLPFAMNALFGDKTPPLTIPQQVQAHADRLRDIATGDDVSATPEWLMPLAEGIAYGTPGAREAALQYTDPATVEWFVNNQQPLIEQKRAFRQQNLDAGP